MSTTAEMRGLLARVVEFDRALPQPAPLLLRWALVAFAYWLTARLSLNLALVHGQVTPIWPPTGIALVAILVLGRRVWPAIALAAFAVNLPIGPSPLGAAFIAAGNTLAPLVSSWLLKRAGFHLELDRLRDAMAIVLLGALTGMTISATVGTSVLILSGSVPANNFAATWTVWWTGDAMGVLLVAPMLLSVWTRPGTRPLGWRGGAELAVLLAVVGIVTFVLFQNRFRLEYLVLPLIMVAAWRFRLLGAAPAALIASVVAIWAAVNSNGPFATETLLEKMVTLQAFNVSLSLASFVLASFVDTREQREEISRRYQSVKIAIAAKTDSINTAAHELRGPLTVLTGYLSLLSEGKLGPPPNKWSAPLNAMAAKAWELNRTIDNLLEAARIEANSAPPSRSQIDLRDVVKRAIERARPRENLVGARVTATLGSEPVRVEADAGQLGRILDNLINNGLTYTVRPPRIDVSAVMNGEKAMVHVADNGVGVAGSEWSHVFDPFHRSPDPAFDNVPGSGLGLYIGRQLAEANGGSLTIENSELGRGTSFVLILPLLKTAPVNNS